MADPLEGISEARQEYADASMNVGQWQAKLDAHPGSVNARQQLAFYTGKLNQVKKRLKAEFGVDVDAEEAPLSN